MVGIFEGQLHWPTTSCPTAVHLPDPTNSSTCMSLWLTACLSPYLGGSTYTGYPPRGDYRPEGYQGFSSSFTPGFSGGKSRGAARGTGGQWCLPVALWLNISLTHSLPNNLILVFNSSFEISLKTGCDILLNKNNENLHMDCCLMVIAKFALTARNYAWKLLIKLPQCYDTIFAHQSASWCQMFNCEN